MSAVLARLTAVRLRMPERQHWAAVLVLGTMLFLYFVAGLSLSGLRSNDGKAAASVAPASFTSSVDFVPDEPPPVPEPLAFREMAPQDAVTFNASIPLSTEPNPAARPFVLKAASEADRLRSLDCLTAAVYYEAAVETTDGQRAVAQVVLNRLRHPAFAKTVCGVVFQGSERSTGCQFTFTCDGALARTPSEAGWQRARKVAEEALAGEVYKPVGYATHYHTNWVVPYWSSSLTKVANVGTHIFYRWEGGWGRPGAFRNSYAGVEPEIGLMRRHSSVPPEADDAAMMAAAADSLPATAADFAGRAVVRRYEPLREQAAAGARADLAKPEVSSSLRWALTGDGASAAAGLAGPAGQAAPVVAPPAPAASPSAGK